MNDNPATSLAALLTSLTETAIVQIVVIVVSAWSKLVWPSRDFS
jgi:hypothetical protein